MAEPGARASALQSCHCRAQAKLPGSRLAPPWAHPLPGPQRPTRTRMCLPWSDRRLPSPAPATPARLALILAWCRYWVAAVQDFDNTWVVNFTVFQDVYGTGGELVGADVNGLIPKPRMWLVAVYWALTTVQPPLAASQLLVWGSPCAEVPPPCLSPLVPSRRMWLRRVCPQLAGHVPGHACDCLAERPASCPAQQCPGWAAEGMTVWGVAHRVCLLLLCLSRCVLLCR